MLPQTDDYRQTEAEVPIALAVVNASLALGLA